MKRVSKISVIVFAISALISASTFTALSVSANSSVFNNGVNSTPTPIIAEATPTATAEAVATPTATATPTDDLKFELKQAYFKGTKKVEGVIAPKAKVSLKAGKRTYKTSANGKGRFTIKVPALTTGTTLTFTIKSAGKIYTRTVTVNPRAPKLNAIKAGAKNVIGTCGDKGAVVTVSILTNGEAKQIGTAKVKRSGAFICKLSTKLLTGDQIIVSISVGNTTTTKNVTVK